MSHSSGGEPSFSAAAGGEAVSALVTAMESAPAAVYCFSLAREPVWANARARALGTDRARFPLIDGRSVADVVDDVLSTGRPETLRGPLGENAAPGTVVARPLQVAGEPGVLLLLESDDGVTDSS